MSVVDDGAVPHWTADHLSSFRGHRGKSLAAIGLVRVASTWDRIGYGANVPPLLPCESQISSDDTRSLRRHPLPSTRKAPDTTRRQLAICCGRFRNTVYRAVDGAMGGNGRS
jgi:hypothetical protein